MDLNGIGPYAPPNCALCLHREVVPEAQCIRSGEASLDLPEFPSLEPNCLARFVGPLDLPS